MARPKDADPERTKATILDAAEDEFAEHGFHGSRMVAIAKRAGSTHALIHYYFDSKDQLYEAVAVRLFDRHLALFARLGAEQGGLSARDVVLGSFDLFWEHPNQVRIMLWEMASGDDRVERATGRFYEVVGGALAALAARGEPACEPGEDPRDTYVSILGALVVYFFRDPTVKRLLGEDRFTEPDRVRRRAHLAALLDQLLQGSGRNTHVESLKPSR